MIIGIAAGSGTKGTSGHKVATTAGSIKQTAESVVSSTTTTTTPVRKVAGSTVTLGASSFAGGKDVQVGLYDVTPGPGQTGNFTVSGDDSYNEILGKISSSMGVARVRTQISDGDKIEISSLSKVTFSPVSAALVTSYGPQSLYAGTFVVGEDIGAGRYVATPASGESGNFNVTGSDSVNEILGSGSSIGVPNVTVTLKKGDKIAISSLDQVNFTPAS